MNKGKLLFLFLLANCAFAGISGGGIPQLSDPINKVFNCMSGPVAVAVTGIGVTMAGMMMVYGHEMNQLGRVLSMLVIGGSVGVGAVNIMTQVFGVSAALI